MEFQHSLANPDFYRPLAHSSPGRRFTAALPDGWIRAEHEIFTHWAPPNSDVPAHGWKAHVSTTLADADSVLAIVAAACADLGTPFKHLTGERYFLAVHHKHGSRTQSGKFVTVYPSDPADALRVLERLERDLDGFVGPYVLTDRRFGASKAVSYRYGAFQMGSRLRPDGTSEQILTTPDGTPVPDERRPQFQLPPGIRDPFAPTEIAAEVAASKGQISINGYTFERAVVHSNGGGAYRAVAPDGTVVFVKEARGCNGYQWDRSTGVERLRREHRTLTDIHAAAPGLCPAPVEHFAQWEHEFLVTEWVPGVPLWTWMATHNPALSPGSTAADVTAYYDRCRRVFASLRDQIDRLHRIGYAFVDLNPRNVLVDDQDRPRLIDFEAAGPLDGGVQPMAAEGYHPPDAARAKLAPAEFDDYGLAALTFAVLCPLLTTVERNAGVLDHVRGVLDELAPVPDDLWAATGRLRRATPLRAPSALRWPNHDEVEADPERWVRWLHDRVRTGLLATADHDGDPVFPTAPAGWSTNRRGLAFGTAGVLLSLHASGHRPDERLVTGLIDGARRDRTKIPPGLLTGHAGIAYVLAELGRIDAALDLLDGIDDAVNEATLGHGAAGIALTLARVHCHTKEYDLLERAVALLERIPAGQSIVDRLGPNEATGWRRGRAGIAIAYHRVSAATGDPHLWDQGLQLLRDELTHALPDGTGLAFRGSQTDNRKLPYLGTGSAGFVAAAGHYLGADEQVDAAYRAALRTTRSRIVLLPGLLDGLSGLGLVLAEQADLTERADRTLRAAAVRSATALFMHAIPHGDGVRFLGGTGSRYSADLATGSAGALLFLARLCGGRPTGLFAPDVAQATDGAQPAHAAVSTDGTERR